MPEGIPVQLADYHPNWPPMAARHAERLLRLGSPLVMVHHIYMTKLLLLTVCLGLFTPPVFSSGNAAGTNSLSTLRPGHPRLLVLDEQLAAVSEMIKTDPQARRICQQLQGEAEKILTEPPLAYEIGGAEHTLLDVSRKVENRVWLLAGLYRLNGDQRFAARARDEMLAAAQFPDWYPKHFLDTAEMTAALGLGYDWLFDYLTPAERLSQPYGMVESLFKHSFGRQFGQIFADANPAFCQFK